MLPSERAERSSVRQAKLTYNGELKVTVAYASFRGIDDVFDDQILVANGSVTATWTMKQY